MKESTVISETENLRACNPDQRTLGLVHKIPATINELNQSEGKFYCVTKRNFLIFF